MKSLSRESLVIIDDRPQTFTHILDGSILIADQLDSTSSTMNVDWFIKQKF